MDISPPPRLDRRTVLRSALLTLGSASLLTSCARPEAGARSANGFADIDQGEAVARGPIGAGLPDTPTIRAIRERGHLRYTGSETLPGFGLLNPATGKIAGFDAGLTQLLAKYVLGKPEIELFTGNSDTREAMLQNHSIDVAVSTYTINEKRAQLVNFAGPYLIVRSGVAVPRVSTNITKLSDLSGRLVAVQPGAAEEALRKAVPDARPVLFEESSQCFTAVQQERVEAWTANTAILTGRTALDSRVRMTDIQFGSSPFGIGLPKDDPEFKNVVNGFLRQIMSDGTWARLWQLTVGVITSGSAPQPPQIGSVPGS
jgi:glutamate transport system substrate-binding protein